MKTTKEQIQKASELFEDKSFKAYTYSGSEIQVISEEHLNEIITLLLLELPSPEPVDLKPTWNYVKEKYLEFHKMESFTENMAIDIDFGYWLIDQYLTEQ